MQYTDRHATRPRHLELAEESSAGCDADFDAAYDDLEREFQEVRIRLRDREA